MAREPPSENATKSPRKRRTNGWRTLPSRIKENPLVLVVALLASAVVALSAFTDAARNLFALVHEATAPRIAGKWVTPTLSFPFEAADNYHLTFEFRVQGNNLSGTLTFSPEGVDEPDRVYRILDGKIDGENLSFRTESEVVGSESKLLPYSDFYEGKVTGGQISFKKWDDIEGGGEVEQFLANRAH
jgi:hypothetical protein